MYRNSVFRTDPFFTGDSNLVSEMDRVDHYMHGYWHPVDATPATPARSPMMPRYLPPRDNEGEKMVRYRYELDQMPRGRRHSHGDMFHNVETMFNDAQKNSTAPSNVHSYRSSKIMTYTSDGLTEPKKYEAFSETTKAPGGVKQTLKRERNSVTGKDRVQAGHFIYDKGHVVEKTDDVRHNDVRVNHDYLNMDHAESDHFHHEWREKAKPTKLVWTRREGDWEEPRHLLKWQHPFSKNYDGSGFDERTGRRVTFKY